MILQKENKALRQKSAAVLNPKNSDVKNLIAKMAKAMFAEPDGIGIAAPQIGVSLQIFLIAKDFLKPPSLRSDLESAKRSGLFPGGRKIDYLVFINPTIKKFSQKKTKDVEGCLSVRGIYGEVSRPEKLTVEFTDEAGKKKSRGASGLLARVIQHEVDHLNGVLFIDKAKSLQKVNQVT